MSTLREDLEAAIEQFETEETETPSTAGDDHAPPEPAQADSEPRADADGEADNQSASEPAPEAASEPDEQPRDERGRFIADERHPDDEQRYPNLTAERVNAAPESWRPAAREGFGELPEAVRREIHRREADISAGLEGAAEAKDLAERFTRVVTPFSSIMAAEGASDPLQAVQGLLETAAGLRMGSEAQKAANIAKLVQHYDVSIEALDSALAANYSGGAPAPASGPQPEQSALDARLKPLEDFVQGLSSRIQETSTARDAEAAQHVDEFEKNAEFIGDVRMEMADLLETSANRGREMSLQEAYDIACQMNPEVKAVLDRRAEASRTESLSSQAAKKRALADSMLHSPQPGSPNGAGGPQSDGSIRGDLERAIAMHEEL